jgi:hypothetical protein
VTGAGRPAPPPRVSEDAGASWYKIAREFGEIKAAVWLPN